jgi:hypothetical protein
MREFAKLQLLKLLASTRPNASELKDSLKSKEIPINWEREPFYGGVRYYGDNDLIIVGYYSPADPLEFESDCKSWFASNIPDYQFESAKEAMEAAEHIFTVTLKINSAFFA